MELRHHASISIAVVALSGLLLAACGAATQARTAATASGAPALAAASSSASRNGEAPIAAASEAPVVAETNPPGDIPDTQAFVTYRSTSGGYSLETPEGWARTEQGGNVQFVDKLDGVGVTLAHATAAPTAGTIMHVDVGAPFQHGRAVEITTTEDVTLPGGPAVRIAYTSNGEPDPVTGKQVRQENAGYVFFRDGTLATLTLYAPLGADNADQWRRMADSFRWN